MPNVTFPTKWVKAILKFLRQKLFSLSKDTAEISVLMVCTANYCRSPMAEGMLRQYLLERGLSKYIKVDSAGSHVAKGGLRPDPRARELVLSSGVDIARLRSRSIQQVDFSNFDYILTMDSHNYEKLYTLCPKEHQHKLSMIMRFAPQLGVIEVPDPYYSNNAGFKQVYNFLLKAIVGLVTSIEENHEFS